LVSCKLCKQHQDFSCNYLKKLIRENNGSLWYLDESANTAIVRRFK
jgi:hypothetical protein